MNLRCYISPVDGRRDFQLVSLEASKETAAVGQLIPLTLTVTNKGYAFKPGTDAQLFWSDDPIITEHDPQIHRITFGFLPPGETRSTWVVPFGIYVPINAGLGRH